MNIHFFSHFKKKSQNKNSLNCRVSPTLMKYSLSPIEGVLEALNSSNRGLTEDEAKSRLERYGLNAVAHEKAPSWFKLLVKNFINPFNLLLFTLAIISLFLGDVEAATIIGVMILLSISMRFIQEYRSNIAAERLKSLVSTQATVIRRAQGSAEPIKREIDIKYLVPGDIIHLCSGDMVPADVMILTSKELFVSQSSLTGESLPVEKHKAPQKVDENANPLEMQNLCFLGTDVHNGSADAIILTTGNKTYFGTMAKTVIGERPRTSFEIGVNKVGWLLIRIMLILVPLVFMINGLTKKDWFDSLLFALSVAVGLTPEMLPMIVTANLASGAIRMSRKKVIVKRLDAIQNIGAIDILCTDKTGTLTQNKVILLRYLDVDGGENPEVLEYGYLNSYFQTGLKNLMDTAILEHAKELRENNVGKIYKKVDEIPFDFCRRRMSVVLQKDPDKDILICKGALEEMLKVCDKVKIGNSIVPISGQAKEKVLDLKKDLNEDGLRVLAVGYREVPNGKRQVFRVEDEHSLTLLGYLAFLDPPKETTHEAILSLKKNNIQIKVLTGDNAVVTKRICKWVGIDTQYILEGSDIEKMDDKVLAEEVEKTSIFAKLDPLQKAKVIRLLKQNNHTVGYLGDGINDAPALREADIGISVDTAVDIAKESADIIMLEKSLLFLEEGVLEGRKTFGNIIKYIKMAVSSNFGNVFSVLGASILLPFLPMKSIQLLTQNLLYDISQIAIPFDNLDKEFLYKPRKWDPKGIAKFMVWIGPISSIFDYTTFAILWYFFGANSIERQALFQSGWFVEGLLSQTLIVHMIRTSKIPFVQSMASWPLLITTSAIMIIGILIPFSFIGKAIGLVPLPWSYFPWLAGTLLAYALLTQTVKLWYIRRFHQWL